MLLDTDSSHIFGSNFFSHIFRYAKIQFFFSPAPPCDSGEFLLFHHPSEMTLIEKLSFVKNSKILVHQSRSTAKISENLSS